jgi:hypothetical protein
MATSVKDRSGVQAETETMEQRGKTTQVRERDGAAPLSEDTLRRLYSYMLKCRMVEERARLLFRQGKFAGNYYAAVGQEATEVGATMDLLLEDTAAPAHRNFVTNIMKGTPLKLMYAQLYARKTSPTRVAPRPRTAATRRATSLLPLPPSMPSLPLEPALRSATRCRRNKTWSSRCTAKAPPAWASGTSR